MLVCILGHDTYKDCWSVKPRYVQHSYSTATAAMSPQSLSAQSTAQRSNVYKVRYGPVDPPDPDVPGVRYHNVIFVETDEDGSGIIHHVTGDLVDGMHYERKPSPRPEDDDTRRFYDKEFLGTVLASSHPAAFDEVLRAQPPPPRQKRFNAKTLRTELFKPDGGFYEPGEPRRPLVKCTEWTQQQAIPALLQSGTIERTKPIVLGSSASAASRPRSSSAASAFSKAEESSERGPDSEREGVE